MVIPQKNNINENATTINLISLICRLVKNTLNFQWILVVKQVLMLFVYFNSESSTLI